MSEETTQNPAPSAPNMRGRLRRGGVKGTVKPTPQAPSNFGLVENIHEVKENLSGANVNGYGDKPAGQESTETVVAVQAETVSIEAVTTVETPSNGDNGAEKPESQTGGNCDTTCTCQADSGTCEKEDTVAEKEQSCCAKEPEAATASVEDRPAEAKVEADLSKPEEKSPELLKTDWRQERKRYIGLRPEPADVRPERVRSRPYEEKAYRAERPDLSERPQRGVHLNTETAETPRMSEYAPSRDRSARNALRKQPSKPEPKKGWWAKLLALLGFGKKKDADASVKARIQGDRPYNRSFRSEHERNRDYRGQGFRHGERSGGHRSGRRRRSGRSGANQRRHSHSDGI